MSDAPNKGGRRPPPPVEASAENKPAERRAFGRPFPPGVSGNPGGRPKSKAISDALQRVLAEPDEKTMRPNLEELARALVAAAKRGDVPAAREILDRLEGKVLAEHKVTTRAETLLERLNQMSDAELEQLEKAEMLPPWFTAAGAEETQG